MIVFFDLHSNMVRFIISKHNIGYGKVKSIYIPIWLDLLSTNYKGTLTQLKDLHSNMVRFIIQKIKERFQLQPEFTFQYG